MDLENQQQDQETDVQSSATKVTDEFNELRNLGLERLDSCLPLIALCESRLLDSPNVSTILKSLTFLNYLVTIEKFRTELFLNSIQIYQNLFSYPVEYYGDIELLTSLLTYVNELFEIYHENEFPVSDASFCTTCQNEHFPILDIIRATFESSFFHGTIQRVNIILSHCLNDTILCLTWRFSYYLTSIISSITCSELQINSWEQLSLHWDLESLMIECGLPVPRDELNDNLLQQHSEGYGEYIYSLLHNTEIDDCTGLVWLSGTINNFLEIAHRCENLYENPPRLEMIWRIALGLINWLIRQDFQDYSFFGPSSISSFSSLPSLPSENQLSSHQQWSFSIKQSYATLSLSNYIKINIFRGILLSNLLADFTREHSSLTRGNWTIRLHSYFQKYLPTLAHEVLDICHEMLLLNNLIPIETKNVCCCLNSSEVEEVILVLLMTNSVLELMIFQIHFLESQGWNHRNLVSYIGSCCSLSWNWIFDDLQTLGTSIEINQPELYQQCGYLKLLSSINDFKQLSNRFHS